MSDEDFNSGNLKDVVVGGDLSMLSIDELKKRIILFEQEISRIRDDISAKETSLKAAQSFFRS